MTLAAERFRISRDAATASGFVGCMRFQNCAAAHFLTKP